MEEETDGAPEFPVPVRFEEKFVRSGGHGGQNVNKVSTTVQLRVDTRCCGLSGRALEKLKLLAGNRLTGDGEILITASEYRTQEQNRQAARARLKNLLETALRPDKRRRPTRPTKASKRRRLDGKHRRGELKRQRDTRNFL